MPIAKEQIRQIISENNISSVADVYALLKGPPVFSILIETARLYLSDTQLYPLQDFSDELNSRVSPSAQIAADSLKGLWEDYCSYRKCGNSTIHKPLKALYNMSGMEE